MRLEMIRAALTGSDPVRAALAGLIIMASNELDNPDVWVHSRSAWDDAIANAEQALADEPAVPTPPADGEVAELVEWLQEEADDYECIGCEDSAAKCNRAAELLQLPMTDLSPTAYALLTLAAELES